MAIDIRLPATEEDFEAIYRLRYDVYVTELGYSQRHADHVRRRIVEPMDNGASLLGAFDGSVLVGTLRTNYAKNSSLGIYEDLFDLRRAKHFHPAQTSITTKFIVAREHRGTHLAIRLATETYKLGRSHGIEFNFIDCKPTLAPFFEFLGYRSIGAPLRHPEYGEVLPMVLPTADIDHFRAIGSPFAHTCEQCPTSRDAVDFFYSTLCRQRQVAHS